MEIDVPLFYKIIGTICRILSSVFLLFSRKKSQCIEKQEVLKWVSESAGTDIRSLQQLWDIGPNSLGKYIEQLNTQGVTWWLMQDLARSTFAVPQVMTRQEMSRSHLVGKSEMKFLRLLLRLKEALERSVGSNGWDRLRVSGDLVAKGVALAASYARMRAVFFVYSYRNELEGLQIEMTGPGYVKVETKMRKDGLMVGYTVSKSGMYVLEISKNNWFAPGSPFQVNVQDPPPGYTGNFGGSLWEKPEVCDSYLSSIIEQPSQPNSFLWDREHEVVPQKNSAEDFPSRPNRKKKNPKVDVESKQQIVELSQIAAAIILARRFTNKMQSRIPELRVERANDNQPELNLWSSIAGPPSLREINYLSPEGATFPIKVGGRRNQRSKAKSSLEWILGRTNDSTQGSESYLSSTISPNEAEVCSQKRKTAITFQTSPQNMVRPFNQCITDNSSRLSETDSMKRTNGRLWAHSTSIGVNTDESWINKKFATDEINKQTISKGVQAGKSFTSSASTEINSFHCNRYALKAAMSQDEYTRSSNPLLLLKEQSCRDSVQSKAKKSEKSETFSSDDTSSSANTNYSEKIIEMDLKVHYETIALTSTDDELSHSECPRRGSKVAADNLFLGDEYRGSVNRLSILTSSEICEKSVFGESSNRIALFKMQDNLRERKHILNKSNSVDGIYTARLMSIDHSSPTEEGVLEKNEVANSPINNPFSVKSSRIGVPSKIAADKLTEEGELKLLRAPDSEGDVQPTLNKFSISNTPLEQKHLHYCNTSSINQTELIRKFELAQFGWEDPSKTKTKRVEQNRFKLLAKKRWTSQTFSRRVVKQGSGSGTCKRHLRKSLSAFIPRLGDHNHVSSSKSNILYSFGPYPEKTDVIHLRTPVRAWKNFWDNIANRSETIVRRDCSIKNKGLVKRRKNALQKRDQEQRELEDFDQNEERKRSSMVSSIEYQIISDNRLIRLTLTNWWIFSRFENAKQHFTKLEKDKTHRFLSDNKIKNNDEHNKAFYPLRTFEQHWDLKNLFDDFNQGLGMPGVANRLGVLASLQSVEPPLTNLGGYEVNYPHLPIASNLSTSSSMAQCHGLGNSHYQLSSP